MFRYVFGALFLGGLWAAVVALGLVLWIAIVPTLLVLVVLATLWGIRRARAAKSARDIENALSAQADAQAKTARPDLQPEIEQMRSEFAKAVSSLKTSKLARGGRDALSILPWYMIIGPPGSGKSTALRNSGLQFPYLSSRGGGVKGVGGTRNCEWWLTNDAVILDTAGRYTTEDDDHDEWFSFLEVLSKNRPKKPINGIMIAVSIGELIEADEEASAQLGQKVRERVDEVMSKLKMILPVYVVFTKCDLLSGFVETFSDLSKNQRGQIWGFTLPVGVKEQTPGEIFNKHFAGLVGGLEERALLRLGQERRVEAREKIFQFPQQFESLRGSVTEFLQVLFAENVYQDTPLMRGVYFTSGTQEGQPFDRVMQAMARAFGIHKMVSKESSPALEAKSYFLRDVFAHVLFPDQKLAGTSTSAAQHQAMLRKMYAAAGFSVAALFLFFPTLAFFQNRALIESTRQLVQEVKTQTVDSSSGRGLSALPKLSPLRQRLDELLRYQRSGPPLSMRFGMYSGHELLASLRNFYGNAVRRILLDPLLAEDLRDMDAFSKAYDGAGRMPSQSEHLLYYHKLKMHLLVSSPKEKTEPTFQDADKGWLSQQVTSRWLRVRGSAADAQAAQELEAHAAVYATLLGEDPSLGVSRNLSTVRKTRQVLSRFPFASLALERIVSAPKLEDFDVTLTQVLGGTTPELQSGSKVRGAFTQTGWNEWVQKNLTSDALREEVWVVGLPGKRAGVLDMGQAVRMMQSNYFKRYIQEWRSFLESIHVGAPNDSAGALAELEDLTRGDPPPWSKVFRTLAYHVRLRDGSETEAALKKQVNRFFGGEDPAASVRQLTGQNVDPSGEKLLELRDVERAFLGLLRFGVPPAPEGEKAAEKPAGGQPVPLDVYQEQLTFLRDAQRTQMENPDDKGPLASRLETARVRVTSLIEGQEIGWRPVLQQWFWPPLQALSGVKEKFDADKVSKDWCSSVLTAFEGKLANKYPFNPTGHDAALADLADFYKPQQGIVWSFFTNSLQSTVAKEGVHYRFVRRLGNGAEGVFKPQVLNFLDRSNEISSALFPPGAAELGTQFAIHIQPAPKVAAVSFVVDGQTIDYKNGPEEWHTLKWPVQGRTLGAAVRVRTHKGVTESIEQEGEWGLLRVLEAGVTKATPGSHVFTTTWRLQALDVEVSIDFRPTRSETPFFGVVRPGQKPQLLQLFRAPNVVPPRSIAKSSDSCSG